MARLRRLSDATSYVLPARCLLGRSQGAHIVLEDRFASSEHARVVWTGAGWEIRDLGSKNGSFLDQRMLEAGISEPLSEGAQIGFGEREPAWVFEDATPPTAMAYDLAHHRQLIAETDLLQLPSSADPELTVYPAADGTGWRGETKDGATREVLDGETVQLSGGSFRIDLPHQTDATPMAELAFHVRNISLRFLVPKSEERISIELVHKKKRIWLEPREHLYFLLTLARAFDEDRRLRAAAAGWRKLDQLERMLGSDETAINVSTHRVRQQLAALGLEGAAQIVEVRRGERRIGTGQFEIIGQGT